MKEKVLIADFTGVYAAEGFIGWMQGSGTPSVHLDLTDICGANCYCDPEAEAEILRRIEAAAPGRVHWIDSGDYHYMTLLFCRRIGTPACLVLLDNHPDDQEPEFGDILSCGGWVRKMPPGWTVLTVGPEGKIPSAAAFREAFSRVHPERVYLSLDKDILSRDEARTDWDQGGFTLDAVREVMETVLDSGAGLLGIDICGERTASKGATPEDYQVNLKTNIAIQRWINGHLDNH